MIAAMSSAERVGTALSLGVPDRVPFNLPAEMHAARALGMPLPEYFRDPFKGVAGQLWLRAQLGNDAVTAYPHAPVEHAAWGGEVLYFDDGPPNAGAPVITNIEDIARLEPPRIADCPCLVAVLEATRSLVAQVKGEAPAVGAVVAPFSLPAMQLGLERYIELLHTRRDLWERLMAVNEEFCVAWATAQVEAGAGGIIYIDPLASTTNIPRALYLETAWPVACRTIARIPGATVTSYASGRTLAQIDDIARTGTIALVASALEPLRAVKDAARGRLAVLGNLNAIDMVRWGADDAERIVKEALADGARDGGFVLADNHGEIPLPVPWDTLLAIREAVLRWGRYPLDWIEPGD